VTPFGSTCRKIGLVTSQPVYPRASKVARRPPDGNELASGSPWRRFWPENSAMVCPSPVGVRNESCFSAVEPVIGTNQCV
jgi:hypothetical protein